MNKQEHQAMKMSECKHALFIRDLGQLIKEYARSAIAEAVASKGTASEDYRAGYMMGYHRMVTLLQQQAEAFGLEPEELQLDDLAEEEFFE